MCANIVRRSDAEIQVESRLSEAFAATKAGLRLFLLKPGSKVPLRIGWQERATTDRRKLNRSLRDHPMCNLGIATGSGIMALDIDGDAGEESYETLSRCHGPLPKTTTSWTGGGGFHSLFRVDRPIPNRVGILPGIDIRGDGGYIVAPPSLHPNGKAYSWLNPPGDGIAPLPKWLLKLIERPNGSKAQVERVSPSTGRVGDLTAIVEDLARRFPVSGIGERHGQMVGAIGRLAGRGYEPDFILEAIDGWHARFRGLYRTNPRTARREAEACLASTLQSMRRGKFSASVGSAEDHAAACREIRLDRKVRGMLHSRMASPSLLNPLLPPNCKRVTLIDGVLCVSDDESAFVEALLVHAIHKVKIGEWHPDDESSRLLMTHDQLRQIVSDRHGGLAWDNKQFERLKAKYISRPGDGKPATRAELLREVVKGRKEPGGRPGVPSEYRATGITRFLPRPDPQTVVGRS
jgi:hypothetical protein